MDEDLEVAKEIEEIALDNNITALELIEMYKKAQSLATKQGKEPIQKLLPTV